MKKLIKIIKTNDAVSPVIGVMLMIVVTVVIAAVVSAFASDMSGGQDTAPVASIQCKIVKEDTNTILTFKHISGDSINTANLKIIVSYTDSGGAPVQKRSTGVNVDDLTNSKGEIVSGKVPYLTDVKEGDVGTEKTNFGSFMWKTGQVLSSGSPKGFSGIIGVSDVNIGDTFNIKLVDTSSQKAIVDQDVTVQ
ncbi:FlaG/FlaF family flagellin (archaellin) [Methanomicrobium sp. W14]|uniref:type IV pilin N-terminal domain-containing protein n=1 Tax=Methanomicrobium sp. W14 TaxID=2817839 RepID=UPI001AE63787|nr:type IV pilin N-terminal domain-containing protein [Methanomicrobium sp. W14]MBP2133474.1 FlaG/FlaF family flagellin (archaellin) [Methanomicrobium sp. W14]